MNDLPIMNMLHTQANLREPVQDLVFREGPTTLGLHTSLKISTIAEVHNDAELTSFSFKNFDESDNVWVIESLQQACLLQSLFFLSFRHPRYVYHLHNAHVTIVDPSHLKGLSKGALTEEFDLLIRFKFRPLFDCMHLLLHHDVG